MYFGFQWLEMPSVLITLAHMTKKNSEYVPKMKNFNYPVCEYKLEERST